VRDELTLISFIVLHKANFITIATFKTYNIYPNWKDGMNLHQNQSWIDALSLAYHYSNPIKYRKISIKQLNIYFFINTV